MSIKYLAHQVRRCEPDPSGPDPVNIIIAVPLARLERLILFGESSRRKVIHEFAVHYPS